MFKSMTRVVSKTSHLSHRNAYRTRTPKTRFSLNERSISSPRLKSFPAEKIKRISRSPVREVPEKMGFPTRQVTNSGQGDTLPDAQNLQPTRPPAMTNQNITSTSEQRISGSVYPVENHVHQSELAIPAGKMDKSMFGQPQHRPFVPNVNHPNIQTIRETSPRKFVAKHSSEPAQNLQDPIPQLMTNEASQGRDPWKIEIDSVAAVNGRKVENLSENKPTIVPTNLQQRVIVSGNQAIPEKSLAKDPNFPDGSRMTDGNLSNVSRQVQPRFPVPHYHQPEAMNHYQAARRQFFEPYWGMTSPQDVAINQIKNYQRSLQFGNYVYGSNQPNNYVCNHQHPTNNLTPLSYVNAPQYYNYPRDNIAPQRMQNHHQCLSANWQQAVQQQHHHHPQEILPQKPEQISDPVKLTNEENKRNQTPQPQTLKPSENLARNWPVMQNEVRDHIPQPQSNKSDNPRKSDEKRKPLKFTPAMIRDQEMLVATMRQQGINEDIMRRQFDALLVEQRKQLLYLEQLKHPETAETKELEQNRRVKRRISRIEEDGKPEWMIHITPPRIPYSVVEKMYSERQAEMRATTEKKSNVGEKTSGIEENPKKEVLDRSSQGCHQYPWQMHPSNLWQQHPQYSHVPGNGNPPKENQTNNPNSFIPEPNHQTHYSSYPAQCQQQLNQQNSENRNEQNSKIEEPKLNSRPVEPSSLLKLRLYKEVVRRQKQNNGLQDIESVKEALEALKNPVNRRGLEYLEKLNKKHEKPVSLNGIQNPEETMVNNRPDFYIADQPKAKVPSANGLENSRNPNNPVPKETLRHRKINECQVSEYPRQRRTSNNPECYNVTAEKENGATAAMMPNQYDSNTTSGTHVPYLFNPQMRLNKSNYPYPGQMSSGAVYNDEKSLSHPTSGIPVAFSPNEQTRFYPQQMQNYYENHGPIRRQMDAAKSYHPVLSQPGFNTDLQEPIIIGGLKYFARKLEYSPNYGKSLHPVITCQ